MRKHICIALFSLLFVLETAHTQELNPVSLWFPFVSVGYGDIPPTAIADYYNTLVQYYRDQGIPIPTQTPFGNTIMANAGMLVRPSPGVSVGLSLGYLHSPAYSSYADNAGTLKVNGSLNTIEIMLVFEGPLVHLWDFPLLLRAEAGVLHASALIEEELKFEGQPVYDFNSTWKASGWGAPFRITMGTSIPLGRFAATAHFGYQFSTTAVTNGKTESTAGNTANYSLIDIGQSGIVLLLGFGMSL